MKQRKDPMLNKTIRVLNNPEEFPEVSCSGFVLVDDLLYKLVEKESGPGLVICIPTNMVEEIISSCHDDPISGHLGFDKTYNKIKTRYFWTTIRSDTKTYIETCRTCQGKKAENKMAAGLLCPIKPEETFEMIGMDLLGPFPSSDRGNRNIIVATDYLTIWAECRALPNGSSLASYFSESIDTELQKQFLLIGENVLKVDLLK